MYYRDSAAPARTATALVAKCFGEGKASLDAGDGVGEDPGSHPLRTQI